MVKRKSNGLGHIHPVHEATATVYSGTGTPACVLSARTTPRYRSRAWPTHVAQIFRLDVILFRTSKACGRALIDGLANSIYLSILVIHP
jgi:hypothetical protein